MNINDLAKYANSLQKEIDQTLGSFSNNTEALGKFLKKRLDEIVLAHSSAIDDAGNWVKQFIYGEFNDEERDVSVIATEMITGFVPGTTLVYSARDAVAVTMRMINHPEKQDDFREWMILVVYLLPFGIVASTAATGAAGGVGVGAGVGAVGAGVGAAPGAAVGGAVGGAGGAIVGSALANLVKCTALFLIKKESSLAKIVNKLDHIVYGNVLGTLKKIKYSDYGQQITSKIVQLGNKLLALTRKVKALLGYAAKVNFMGAGWAKDIYKRMELFESALVSLIQKSANKVKQVLQEFDKQMQELLKQTYKMEHAYATVGTKVKPVPPPNQVVRPSLPATATANAAHTAGASTHASSGSGSGKPPENVHQPKAKEPTVKKMKETKVKCFNQVTTDAAKKNAAKLIKEDYPKGSKNLSVDEYLKKETDWQLANQQKGLNEMSVDDYINGRKAFDTNGRGSGAPAAAARDKYERSLIEKYEKEYQKQDIGAREAKNLAKAKSERIMNEMAALHDPDQIAAGVNKIGDRAVGLKNVNSSIGSQWKTRVEDLDAAAAKIPANERSSTSMNAKLERCKK